MKRVALGLLIALAAFGAGYVVASASLDVVCECEFNGPASTLIHLHNNNPPRKI